MHCGQQPSGGRHTSASESSPVAPQVSPHWDPPLLTAHIVQRRHSTSMHIRSMLSMGREGDLRRMDARVVWIGFNER